MAISLNYSPNLDRPEVYAFLRDTPTPGNWSEAIPAQKNGFNLSTSAKKLVGTITDSTPGKTLRHVWSIQEYYTVSEGNGQKVGNFDVIIPVLQQFSISVFSVLYIHSTVPPELAGQIEARRSQI